MNLSIPFSNEPIVAAPPFQFAGDAETWSHALGCLTAAIYYEAGNEDAAGKQAVAQVVLNRVRHPAFPASVCGVVFQGSTLPTGCQFTFTCDGSLMRVPDRRSWIAAQTIAAGALSGTVYTPIGFSTHYHADYVVPYWATKLAKTAQVGTHIFYEWPGAWADLRPFRSRYDGDEADPVALRAAALMAHGLWSDSTRDTSDAPVTFTVDPQIQLVGVIGLLSAAQPDKATPYEREVRAYFGSVEDASAVKLLRDAQNGSDAPISSDQDSSVTSAVRDFALKGDFAGFFRSHRRYYQRSAAELQRELAPVLSDWEAYTALPVKPGKVTIAIGFDAPAACAATKLLDHQQFWIVAANDFHGDEADILIRSGVSVFDPAGASGTSDPVVAAPLQEQIIRAVFARIVALSSGEAAGKAAISREAGRGFKLVPVLAARLQDYERHRAAYATLNDFLPILARGLGDAALPVEAPANGAITMRENSPMKGCSANLSEIQTDQPARASDRANKSPDKTSLASVVE